MAAVTLVRYLCWGCGATMEQYEDLGIPVAELEKWNICPDCQSKSKEVPGDGIH